MDVVVANLIDSNVFLRSLYLTMEFISDTAAQYEGPDESDAAEASTCYLTHSWIQCHPAVASQRAVDKLVDSAGAKGSNWATGGSSPSVDAFKGLYFAASQMVKWHYNDLPQNTDICNIYTVYFFALCTCRETSQIGRLQVLLAVRITRTRTPLAAPLLRRRRSGVAGCSQTLCLDCPYFCAESERMCYCGSWTPCPSTR